MGIVPTRRSVLLGGVVAPLAARMAAGQISSWPSGPIRIVVPFAAGGSIDMIARVVQPGLQQRLGNVIIVDNRPGASGSAGAAFVAKSPPDGTTWLRPTPSTHFVDLTASVWQRWPERPPEW